MIKKFVNSEAGYNFEPSEIFAFGLIQLKKFKKFSNIRNKIFIYIEIFLIILKIFLYYLKF